MENYMERNDGCNESDILFYIEWAQQREPSIQFHIESVLNGVWVRHYSTLNGGQQTPNVRCLFLFNKSRPPVLVFSPITYLIFKRLHLQHDRVRRHVIRVLKLLPTLYT